MHTSPRGSQGGERSPSNLAGGRQIQDVWRGGSAPGAHSERAAFGSSALMHASSAPLRLGAPKQLPFLSACACHRQTALLLGGTALVPGRSLEERAAAHPCTALQPSICGYVHARFGWKPSHTAAHLIAAYVHTRVRAHTHTYTRMHAHTYVRTHPREPLHDGSLLADGAAASGDVIRVSIVPANA